VAAAEVWVLGDPVVACVFLTPRDDALYVGKLAVHPDHQGRGFARVLLDHAAARARSLGLPALELQTRVELVENHAAFRAMGFERTGETAHDGFTRPTSFTYRKPV
jgi:GNAT superfamily N-acetyltransferase